MGSYMQNINCICALYTDETQHKDVSIKNVFFSNSLLSVVLHSSATNNLKLSYVQLSLHLNSIYPTVH